MPYEGTDLCLALVGQLKLSIVKQHEEARRLQAAKGFHPVPQGFYHLVHFWSLRLIATQFVEVDLFHCCCLLLHFVSLFADPLGTASAPDGRSYFLTPPLVHSAQCANVRF